MRQEEINLLYRDLLPKPVASANNEATSEKNENDPPSPELTQAHNTNKPEVRPKPNANHSPETEFDFVPCSFITALCDIKVDPKIENHSIMCPHNKLKPPGPSDISVAYRIIPPHFSSVIFERYEWDSRLTGKAALCLECVKVNWKILNDLAGLEEDYKMFLELIKDAPTPGSNEGVWLSNEVKNSWKGGAKSAISTESDGDISMVDADGSETSVNSELRCDHGKFSLSSFLVTQQYHSKKELNKLQCKNLNI